MAACFMIKTAMRYLRRSYNSTWILGLMIFTAVGCLVFLSALAVGTNDAMIRNSVGLFTGHIAGSDLPEGLNPVDLAAAGTAGVLIRRTRPAVLAGVNDLKMASVLLTGIDPASERRLTALWKKTTVGRYLDSRQPGIYLSRPMAANLSVSVGDTLQVQLDAPPILLSWTVCGIYQTGMSSLDYGVAFCPQQFLPEKGAAVSAAIFLEEGAAAEPALEVLRKNFESAHFVPWTTFMPDLRQLIDLNVISMTIVMLLVFGVVSIGIACAFVIFILRSIREYGILKALGVLPGEVVVFILAQVTQLTLIAALAGTVAGAAVVAALARSGIDLSAFTSYNPYFAVSGVIYPRLTLFSAWLPALLALFFGFLAAIWPALYVVRRKAADILRSI